MVRQVRVKSVLGVQFEVDGPDVLLPVVSRLDGSHGRQGPNPDYVADVRSARLELRQFVNGGCQTISQADVIAGQRHCGEAEKAVEIPDRWLGQPLLSQVVI
jgi:hypothetical protein